MNATFTSVSAPVGLQRIALAGNPNAGKTTLFNALTGMRQRVGNYPGVTVEKKEGRARLGNGTEVSILDLPGTYSLSPKSPDEEIARDVLLGLRAETPPPDAVIVVVDASNLARNLYLATQVLDLGIPTVIALNMVDLAQQAGHAIDVVALSQEIGAPVVEIVASRGIGLDDLRAALCAPIPRPHPPLLKLEAALESAKNELAESLRGHDTTHNLEGAALRLLCGNAGERAVERTYGSAVAATLAEIRHNAEFDIASETSARYDAISPIVARVQVQNTVATKNSFTDRADRILAHPTWGLLAFFAVVLVVFQAIYSFSEWPMNGIEALTGFAGDFLSNRLPDGPLRDLLVQGVIAGVGGVIVFLPQIFILFFFLGILEDSGYMARAAFVMDKHMGRVGLHGRAFIPLLSSFACAIPGVMATRTIDNPRDRLTTILIAPLMSCSARLPVYTLMIGTFIPEIKVFGLVSSRALTMISLYIFGVAAAMGVAFLLKRTMFKAPTPSLMLELPPFRMPTARNVLLVMWERGSEFLKRAGTTIFALSILLWFLLNYPRVDVSKIEPNAAPGQVAAIQTRNSFAGRVGHFIEPTIAPIGFNWKIGVGLIGAMAAREVFVSTMGTVYSVSEADEASKPLRQAMREDKWPDGRPVWTTLTAVSILVYFVLAMQCVSTLAIVKRETGGWKWPIFMQIYMTALAWIASFIIFQGGKLLGF
ncbi:ferrous iron transport protein B [Abditibacterium utsteinense]|uniref:Ferrous iron transport protein B n=1 Tax=Abditibacterium utsteinense TaxID=1960156 RepID=A0A2S8SX81_9BACT|nr:ferrous iron transport protein B [Abditibacterium utsteinense]PQV65412.1 ferrous iron transport protein B [Abditibacterium utsteinense]